MKRSSTLPIIREMQIKATMRLSPPPGQNGHHQKNQQALNAREGVEKTEPSYIVGGNVYLQSGTTTLENSTNVL